MNAGDVGEQTLRETIRRLQENNEELKARNVQLQRMVNRELSLHRHEITKWPAVRKQLSQELKRLILGLNPLLHRPYPKDKDVQNAILRAFNIRPTDIDVRNAFYQAWNDSLKREVKTYIVNRRGSYTNTARAALFKYLGVPRPKEETEQVLSEWKERLSVLYQGMILNFLMI